jgi:hypothetical protein
VEEKGVESVVIVRQRRIQLGSREESKYSNLVQALLVPRSVWQMGIVRQDLDTIPLVGWRKN